nr:copia protein [Tanacetum cinerariifolium]
MGHFARECKSPRNKKSKLRNQDNSRNTMIIEDTSSKAIVAIDGAGLFAPPSIDLSYYSLEEFKQPEFEGYGPKANLDAPIIEDWVFDSNEDESEEIVLKSNNVQHKPEQANQPRKVSQNPRNNKTNWNEMRTQNTARQSSSRASAPVSAVRPINTNVNKPLVNVAKPRQNALQTTHSLSRRPFYQQTTLKDKNLNNNINATKANSVNTAKGNKVISAVGKQGLMMLSPQHAGFGDLKLKSTIMSPKIVDHTFHDGGYVAFGGGVKGGKITGKGTIRTGKLDLEDVYFVKELQFNLFSVSQMYDKKNSVFFTDTECFVLSPNFKLDDESQVLLKVPRKNNMYSFDIKNIVPQKDLTCLHAKATNDKSMLWHRRLDQLRKFNGKSNEGIFVSYSTTSKAFKVYNIRTRKVEENFHITFLENKPMIAGGGPEWLFDLDALLKSMNYAPVSAGTNSNDFTGKGASFDVASNGHNKDKHSPSQTSESDNQERHNAKSSTKTVDTIGPVNNVDSSNDPLMANLEDAGIFDDAYDDKDEGAEADYNNLETIIPVSPIPSTRIHKVISSLCIVYGFHCLPNGCEKCILYGTIEEEVYVSQPPGCVDPAFPDRVCKVEKALYSLHQAPRAWYETLSTYLLDNRFRRGTIDKTLFIKKIKDGILLVQVYVDDIIFGFTKRSLSTEFEQLMHERFQISSMGELTLFLGLQVEQRKDGIFLSQEKYVSDILKKFGFSSVKSASAPMETHKPLSKDENGIDVDVHFLALLF